MASVTAFEIARRDHQVAATQPVAPNGPYTSTTTTAPTTASWPHSYPAGPSMAGTSVPAIDNLLDAAAAVSPFGPQR